MGNNYTDIDKDELKKIIRRPGEDINNSVRGASTMKPVIGGGNKGNKNKEKDK